MSARRAGGTVPPSGIPRVASKADFSSLSFSVVSASASFLASSSHRSAVNIALETESITVADIKVSFLRALASELVANLRAIPMWP